MKEKLNKNETMSSVTQLRPSTKVKHPDDCRPMNFSSSSIFFYQVLLGNYFPSCHGYVQYFCIDV